MTVRYAIYWAPPSADPLGRFGAEWLGRDAETNEGVAQPRVAGVSPDELARLTAEARRYGFHATLKPPFALAPGRSEDDLLAAVAAFTRRRAKVLLPGLALVSLDGFLALTPADRSPALEALAEDCVRAFETFRAPPSEAELARRRAAGLTLRQEELLKRWGYPYVLDEFRFHLTLTGRLDADQRRRLEPELARRVAVFAGPLAIDAVSVFREAAPGAPFSVVARLGLESA